MHGQLYHESSLCCREWLLVKSKPLNLFYKLNYTEPSLFLHYSGISTVVNNNSPPMRYSSCSPPDTRQQDDSDSLLVPKVSQPSTVSNGDDITMVRNLL